MFSLYIIRYIWPFCDSSSLSPKGKYLGFWGDSFYFSNISGHFMTFQKSAQNWPKKLRFLSILAQIMYSCVVMWKSVFYKWVQSVFYKLVQFEVISKDGNLLNKTNMQRWRCKYNCGTTVCSNRMFFCEQHCNTPPSSMSSFSPAWSRGSGSCSSLLMPSRGSGFSSRLCRSLSGGFGWLALILFMMASWAATLSKAFCRSAYHISFTLSTKPLYNVEIR